MMKKIIALILAAMMLLTLVACGNDANNDKETDTDANVNDTVDTNDENKETEGAADDGVIAPAVDENTLAYVFFETFKQIKAENPNMSAEELANALVASKAGQVAIGMGMGMAVEPGMLQGFDENEITGFESGAIFSPMMGYGFIGYVFELAEGADVKAFMADLETKSNLSWMVCYTAEMKAVGAVDNTVFFIMCPKEIPAALSGVAQIIEPNTENAPNGAALFEAFKAIMEGNPDATSEGVAYQMLDAEAFAALGSAGAVTAAPVIMEDGGKLEGFTMDIYNPEGHCFKAEGNDSFIGYVFGFDLGVDVTYWIESAVSCAESSQVIAGAYNSTVIIMMNTDIA